MIGVWWAQETTSVVCRRPLVFIHFLSASLRKLVWQSVNSCFYAFALKTKEEDWLDKQQSFIVKERPNRILPFVAKARTFLLVRLQDECKTGLLDSHELQFQATRQTSFWGFLQLIKFFFSLKRMLLSHAKVLKKPYLSFVSHFTSLNLQNNALHIFLYTIFLCCWVITIT